ncbi:hypothetical protein HK105_203444 [Polyrhizophydium stewartii]|uniref:DUF7223 domain-containing protein n=1 Tax=Polyrhizophydium stewartii TaxID=2732419 RepID=A0ABR4NBZ8_9FUNG
MEGRGDPDPNVGSLSTGCTPCGIHGASTATFRAKGSLFKKPNFSFTWEGHVEVVANMFFKTKINAKKTTNGEVVIVDQPIGAINIAGILVLGPELTLLGRADVAVLGDVDVVADISASLPHFRAYYSSIDPKSVTGFEPVYGLKTNADVNFDAKIAVGLTPKLAVVAKVFGFDLSRSSLALEASAALAFGVHASAHATAANGAKPAAGAQAQACVELDMGMRLIGELFGKSKDLVSVPMRPLVNKCIGAAAATPKLH